MKKENLMNNIVHDNFLKLEEQFLIFKKYNKIKTRFDFLTKILNYTNIEATEICKQYQNFLDGKI